jgi:IS30 family transposase
MRNKPALSLEDRKEIEWLLKTSDLSLTKIAASMKRAKNSIIFEVRRNGGSKVYNAESAHIEYLKRLAHKKSFLSARNRGHSIKERYGDRIEAIEMQLDIIFKQLEKLTKEIK